MVLDQKHKKISKMQNQITRSSGMLGNHGRRMSESAILAKRRL